MGAKGWKRGAKFEQWAGVNLTAKGLNARHVCSVPMRHATAASCWVLGK